LKMYYGVVMSMSLVSNSSSASSIVHVASDSVQRKHRSPCRRLEKRIARAKSLPSRSGKKKPGEVKRKKRRVAYSAASLRMTRRARSPPLSSPSAAAASAAAIAAATAGLCAIGVAGADAVPCATSASRADADE